MQLMGNIAGIGFITVIIAGAGIALYNATGPGPLTGAGPPVLPDGLSPAPPRPAPAKPPAAQFSADAYGQFWIAGTANGESFQFLADTGASDVTFSKRDARRLGINVNRLSFSGRSSTANGIVRTAAARVARLTVGPFTVTDFPVSINDGELDFPLLGMTFLRRMNVTIGNNTLTLTGDP